MEGNNRQQRPASQLIALERLLPLNISPETCSTKRKKTGCSMFSVCSKKASDDLVDIPASNVTQDPIVTQPTSFVNNPDNIEHKGINVVEDLSNLDNTDIPEATKPGPSRKTKCPKRAEQATDDTQTAELGTDMQGQTGRDRESQTQKQNQDQKIKFMINVPMCVSLTVENQNPVQNLLELLEDTGFSDNDKVHLEDVAMVIGLNCYCYSDHLERHEVVQNKDTKSAVKFKIISFTWESEGDIKHTDDKPPYQKIRDHIKNDQATKELVRELRGQDPDALIYFSFIDADTVSFNQVYSSYLEIVRQHSNTHNGIPPTVMSTGYEFPKNSGKLQRASQIDNHIRIITAKHFPLGTYYPEPNFCVLLPEGDDTLTESFESTGQNQNVESPNLIKRVKQREHFKAIFPEGKPIITSVPERCQIEENGLSTAQSHYKPWNWATSANIHGEIKSKLKGQGSFGKTRGFLMELLTCPNDKFGNTCKELPVVKDDAFQKLCEAAAEVREYRKKVREDQNQQDESRQAESRQAESRQAGSRQAESRQAGSRQAESRAKQPEM